MKYRKLGRLDWEASALGFGAMRLPTKEGVALSPNITEDEAVKMIRHAIDNGVNFVDTAFFYHRGKSEAMVGKALADGYRSKVRIATKSPILVIDTPEDYDKILDKQLMRLGVDMIDFYLFHGLSAQSWEKLKRLELFSKAEAAQKAGKIGQICFSFHDRYEVFEDIINGYDKWAYCQIQYNFMDEDFQAGAKGLKLAASKDIGVVVMEPLKGGKLTNPIPEAADIMKKRGLGASLTSLALRWVWNQPEVSTVLSGMSDMKQVEENLALADGPYDVSREELDAIAEIKALFESRKTVPCTGCAYCMPCPKEIVIPATLNLYNEKVIYDCFVESQRSYYLSGSQGGKCVSCKECEKKCPQGISISEWMHKIHELLSIKNA